MKHTQKWCWLLLLAITQIGCSALRIASDFDKNVDFTKLKTFQFHQKGIEQLSLNNLDKPRMLNAIESTLLNKGFEKSSQADFLVNVVVLNNPKTKAEWGYSGGGYQWSGVDAAYKWTDSQYGPLNTNKQFVSGTIIIDFLNPRTKEIMWHGIAMDFDFEDFYNREYKIASAVKQILMRYQPHTYR